MRNENDIILEQSLQELFTYRYSSNRIEILEIESVLIKSFCLFGLVILIPIWTVQWGLDNLFFWIHCSRNDKPFKFFSFTSFDSVTPFHQIGIIDNKIKFDISSVEHPPPHFHVYIDKKKYSFDIKNGHQLKGGKLKSREIKKIKSWYLDNRKLIINTWNNTRPTDCPVGPFKEEANIELKENY